MQAIFMTWLKMAPSGDKDKALMAMGLASKSQDGELDIACLKQRLKSL
jgi:hypothetical protein